MPAGEKGDELRQSIMQIYHKKGTVEAAIEYMRPYFQEFRRRYPSHTGIFWATDWAMTGIIPAERKAAAVTQAGRAAPARNGRLEEPDENKYLKSLARFGVPMETEE
jgi:hypothetical protein